MLTLEMVKESLALKEKEREEDLVLKKLREKAEEAFEIHREAERLSENKVNSIMDMEYKQLEKLRNETYAVYAATVKEPEEQYYTKRNKLIREDMALISDLYRKRNRAETKLHRYEKKKRGY